MTQHAHGSEEAACRWCNDGCGWYTSYSGGVAHWRHCDYCNGDAVTKPDPRAAKAAGNGGAK